MTITVQQFSRYVGEEIHVSAIYGIDVDGRFVPKYTRVTIGKWKRNRTMVVTVIPHKDVPRPLQMPHTVVTSRVYELEVQSLDGNMYRRATIK